MAEKVQPGIEPAVRWLTLTIAADEVALPLVDTADARALENEATAPGHVAELFCTGPQPADGGVLQA